MATPNEDHASAQRTTRRRTAAKPKAGRKPPPAGETSRQRFLRIGAPRMAKAIQGIRLLGNLARGNYEWSPEDAERMKASLYAEIDKVFGEFERSKGRTKEKPVFVFPE